MATVLSICRYVSTFLVVTILCSLPVCGSGKMKKLNSRDNPNGLRLIKVFHKRYSRRLENVRTLEEFIKVFEKNVNVEETIQELLLEQTLPDQRENVQRFILQPANNEQNASDVILQWDKQMSDTECREPRPVLLDAHDVLGIVKGYLRFPMPRCIQVNRCGDHSGCCTNEAFSCRVAQGAVRNVTRQVALGTIYIDSVSKRKKTRDVEIRTLQVEEHTRCECKELHVRDCASVRCPRFKTKDPSTCNCTCPKRCPDPYVPNPDTCECECGTDSTDTGRKCKKVWRGKLKIPPNECRCVRRTQCNVPTCKSRYHFNNTTCECTRTQTLERILDDSVSDYYGRLIEADLTVRSRNILPPGELSSNEERVLADESIVKSMQRSGPDGETHERIDPKLGDVSPEASEYRHSSHTSYNDTHSVHAKHNASGSTKAKITVWEKSSDDLNATNIKGKSSVSLKPNGTEHQTISTRKSANLSPLLTNAVPDFSERPAEEDDPNFINVHVLGESEIMATVSTEGNTGDAGEFYRLFSSSSDSFSSYSSWDNLEKEEKEEDELDLFSTEFENEDLETYKFTEGSGDYKFGGY